MDFALTPEFGGAGSSYTAVTVLLEEPGPLAVASLLNRAIGFGTETILKFGTEAHGGCGFTLEFDIQRRLRDARLSVIDDGSSQIQPNLIARRMGR